jgi:hypothetical protein
MDLLLLLLQTRQSQLIPGEMAVLQTNEVRTRLIGGNTTIQGSMLATNYRVMILADPEDVVRQFIAIVICCIIGSTTQSSSDQLRSDLVQYLTHASTLGNRSFTDTHTCN